MEPGAVPGEAAAGSAPVRSCFAGRYVSSRTVASRSTAARWLVHALAALSENLGPPLSTGLRGANASGLLTLHKWGAIAVTPPTWHFRLVEILPTSKRRVIAGCSGRRGRPSNDTSAPHRLSFEARCAPMRRTIPLSARRRSSRYDRRGARIDYVPGPPATGAAGPLPGNMATRRFQACHARWPAARTRQVAERVAQETACRGLVRASMMQVINDRRRRAWRRNPGCRQRPLHQLRSARP